MEFTISFIQLFCWGIYLFLPLLVMFSLVVVVLGLIVGRIESWQTFDALYWTFITALTVGYGDIRPLRKSSRILSIMIAAIGIMFSGMLVAITVETSSRALQQHISPQVLDKIKQSVK